MSPDSCNVANEVGLSIVAMLLMTSSLSIVYLLRMNWPLTIRRHAHYTNVILM